MTVYSYDIKLFEWIKKRRVLYAVYDDYAVPTSGNKIVIHGITRQIEFHHVGNYVSEKIDIQFYSYKNQVNDIVALFSVRYRDDVAVYDNYEFIKRGHY